jgi:hypothetical protein
MRRRKTRSCGLPLALILPLCALAGDAFQPSGCAEIDAARRSVSADTTTAENYRERSLPMFLWLAAIQ